MELRGNYRLGEWWEKTNTHHPHQPSSSSTSTGGGGSGGGVHSPDGGTQPGRGRGHNSLSLLLIAAQSSQHTAYAHLGRCGA